MLIGCDIDGTLLDYDYRLGAFPGVNRELIGRLRALPVDEIVLISNQGGLPFGVPNIERKDGRRYPTPTDFVNRLVYLAGALALRGIAIRGLWVCVYHPRAEKDHVFRAAYDLDVALVRYLAFAPRVFLAEEFRKPSPRMLIDATVDRYYGDSDEDEQAATSAGVEFVRVERFFGQS